MAVRTKPIIEVFLYLGGDKPQGFGIQYNATAIYWSEIEGPHCSVTSGEINGRLKYEVPFVETAGVTCQ